MFTKTCLPLCRVSRDLAKPTYVIRDPSCVLIVMDIFCENPIAAISSHPSLNLPVVSRCPRASGVPGRSCPALALKTASSSPVPSFPLENTFSRGIKLWRLLTLKYSGIMKVAGTTGRRGTSFILEIKKTTRNPGHEFVMITATAMSASGQV